MRAKVYDMSAGKPQTYHGILPVSLAVFMIMIVMAASCVKLKDKKAAYDKQEAYLLEEIAKQEQRAVEIEEYAKYKQTKQYIEDMAKEKLGLVYKDEIIFEAEN